MAQQNEIQAQITQIQSDIKNTISSIEKLENQQQHQQQLPYNQLSFPSTPLIPSSPSSGFSTPSSSLANSISSTPISFNEDFYRNNAINSTAQFPNYLNSNFTCKVCNRELNKDNVKCFRCHV